MELSLGAPGLIAYLLAFARAMGWLIVVPPFNNRKLIPTVATLTIASGLASLAGPAIPRATLPVTLAGLVGDLVTSTITGLALGFLIYMLMAAVTAAGSLLDQAGGLTVPPSIDPLSINQAPLLGQFYEQVAVLLVFVSGAYLVMIQGFVHSFQEPAFTLASSGRVASVMVTDFGVFFTSAIEIAAPILVVLFGAQVVLAMLSKAAPQVNVWILGFPFQVFLVLVLVALSISVLPNYVFGLLTRALIDGSHLF